MFRKVSSLPARPSIPLKEEILEDLANALPEDVVFQSSEENNKNGIKQPKKMFKDYGDYEFENETTLPSYLKVDSFLNKINCLKSNMTTLKEQRKNMKQLEENLLKDMTRIKKELNPDKL